MKKFLLATVALATLGVASQASAADLGARYTKAPPMMVAIYDWSGFYIGANGGYGSTRDRWANPVNGFDLGRHDADGGVGGGQVGYRWQSGSFVYGLEAQGDYASMTGSHIDPAFPTRSDNSRLKAFGLFTGQIGYAWNNTLLYAKGGAAVTSTRYDVAFPGLGTTARTNDISRWGSTVGAGLEYGFTPNWSFAVEYDHLFIGRGNADFNLVSTGALAGTLRTGGDADLVTARINYKWGGPAVAKY